MSGAGAAMASEALDVTSMMAWLGWVPQKTAGVPAMYRRRVYFSYRVQATGCTATSWNTILYPSQRPHTRPRVGVDAHPGYQWPKKHKAHFINEPKQHGVSQHHSGSAPILRFPSLDRGPPQSALTANVPLGSRVTAVCGVGCGLWVVGRDVSAVAPPLPCHVAV